MVARGNFASAEPLHRQIDRLIAAGRPDFEAKAAPLADDAEFLRRVWLDLTGTVPTSAEARAFLDDRSPEKRTRLVDRLLAAPEHARRLARVFDVLWMERRPDKHVPRGEWLEYLRAAFAANRPLDELVREILAADGTDPKSRPAAKFFLDRDADPHVLTRDLGRLFLGMNLQCAQCHDHPIVDAYKQAHYYGLFAFVGRSTVFADKKSLNKGVLAEKAEGEATFQSVFDPAKATRGAVPQVPGAAARPDPKLDKGKEYLTKPADGVRPVPAYSRRAQLAPQVVGSRLFARAMANRLWAVLMGRGLVHPVDLDHPNNPPSHPELLDRLTDELVAHRFEVRWFLRELALSRTYQRSSAAPAGKDEDEPVRFASATLRPLSPEQLAFALAQATGLADAERKALGAKLTEPALDAKLAPAVAPVVATFAGGPGLPDSFQATLDQALFVNNGGLVRTWLAPRAGNLTDRLLALKDPAARADELYLSVLSRRPTAEERREAEEYLRGTANPTAALQDLAWALLASAEFRFNH